ncbi:MAG: hypothetical protein U0441_03845 [Polyangiaceae bacterium]
MNRTRMSLVALALAFSVAGAAFGARSKPAGPAPADAPIPTLDAFGVADVLSEAPTDTVVVTLDSPKHPLRGAMPETAFGADDDTFVKAAPRARRIILAGADPVRVDRVAHQLMHTGRRVTVLAGGTDGWDRAMDADPPSPPAGASDKVLQQYRTNVALRRSFGDAAAAAAPVNPVVAPVAPASGGGGGPKKREGC